LRPHHLRVTDVDHQCAKSEQHHREQRDEDSDGAIVVAPTAAQAVHQ
jgi:hypothetical protein